MSGKTDNKVSKRFHIIAIQKNYEYYKRGCLARGETPKGVLEWYADEVKALHDDFDSGVLEGYEVILHDKDKKDGEPKPEHLHAMLNIKTARTESAIIKRYGITRGADLALFNKPGVPKQQQYTSMMAYHQHRTEEAMHAGKHVYSLDEVTFEGKFPRGLTPANAPERARKSLDENTVVFERLTPKEIRTAVAVLEGLVVPNDMDSDSIQQWAEEYFGDSVNDENSKAFQFLVGAKTKIENMLEVKAGARKRIEMDLHVNAFFQGNSGSGKTAGAEILKEETFGGNAFLISPESLNESGNADKTADPFDGYLGEQMAYADEASALKIGNEALLAVLDGKGNVSSRFAKKSLKRLDFEVFGSAQGYDEVIQKQIATEKDLRVSNRRGGSPESRLPMVKADGTELIQLNRTPLAFSKLYQLERRFDYLVTFGYGGWLKVQKRVLLPAGTRPGQLNDEATWSAPRFSRWSVVRGVKTKAYSPELIEDARALGKLFTGEVAFDDFGTDDQSLDFEFVAELKPTKAQEVLGEFYNEIVKPCIKDGSILSKEFLYPIYRDVESFRGADPHFIISHLNFEDYLKQLIRLDGFDVVDLEHKRVPDYSKLNIDYNLLSELIGEFPTGLDVNKRLWGSYLPHWFEIKTQLGA